MPLKLENRDHIGEELSEISRQFLDGEITPEECTRGWILSIAQSTVFGGSPLPENQVRDLALFLNRWGA